MNLKISIITIAYNCESEIEDTILSVISQKYENKEYLIIDGGSKDRTIDVVEKYHNQIDVIISEPDKGRSDAFNKGITHATGDYIVMINAGDLLADNALQKFADTYVPGYDVIKGNTIRWNAETGYKTIERPVIKYPAIPFNFYVCHQSTYIRKTAYEKWGGYRVNYKIAMDLELMLRLTKGGATFYAVDENLAIFRMGGISQTADEKRIKEMESAMLDNDHDIISTFIFVIYIRIRTMIRKVLDKINPDIKSTIITNKIN